MLREALEKTNSVLLSKTSYGQPTEVVPELMELQVLYSQVSKEAHYQGNQLIKGKDRASKNGASWKHLHIISVVESIFTVYMYMYPVSCFCCSFFFCFVFVCGFFLLKRLSSHMALASLSPCQ